MPIWDNFVRRFSPTFLFQRDFMEYHVHKFEDYSLLIFNQEELVAICPAHREGKFFKSHWGLSYGGVIWKSGLSINIVGAVTDELMVFLQQEGFKHLTVKELPEFYMDEVAQRQNVVFKAEAQTVDEHRVFAIDYGQSLSIHKTKLKHYRRGHNFNFQIDCSNDFAQFWNEVLTPRLASKHQVKPVHSLQEIALLASRFPDKILQYTIKHNNEILAGITIFDKGKIIKSQYGATTKKGEKFRALEYLFLHLIYKYQAEGKSYFSMGTASDRRFSEGINPGLRKQKEELGCSEYRQQFYTFKLQ